MDFSIPKNASHKLVDIEKQVPQYIESNIIKSEDSFQETESKRNNNLNSFKTETGVHSSSNHDSFFPNIINDEIQGPPYGDIFCEYSNIKMTTDLNICNSTSNRERTIFDDADYFSKNYSYKLLPISFEIVNEKIIHSEHNYCNLSLTSGSETEEDCSRTMDYMQLKEKNYKKRKSKFKEDVINQNLIKTNAVSENNLISITMNENIVEKSIFHISNSKNSSLIYPLNLSAALVQDKKTERSGGESPDVNTSDKNAAIIRNKMSNIDSDNKEWKENKKEKEKNDSIQFDSDKENKKLSKNLIEVTIMRSDGENYEPCDSFLNDIARLVPKIVEKDCSEINILDHTCDNYVNFENHRLYYVISESTWHLFQNAKERVILTNDKSLGQPVQKQEKNERPTFLIFDQFSLAKCLADYCKEIGGYFEYKFVEDEIEGIINTSEKLLQNKKVKNDEFEESIVRNSSHSMVIKSNEASSDKKYETFTENKSFCLKNNLTKIISDHSCETVGKYKDEVIGDKCNFLKERNEEKICPVVSQNIKELGVNIGRSLNQKTNITDNINEITNAEVTIQKPLTINLNENCDINTDKTEKIEKEENESKYCCKNGINKLIQKTDDVISGNEDGWKEAVEVPEKKIYKRKKTKIKNEDKSRSFNSNSSLSSASDQIPASESSGLKKRTLGKVDDENHKKSKIIVEENLSVRTRSKSAPEIDIKKVEFGKAVTSQTISDNTSVDTSVKGIRRTHCFPKNFRKSMRISGADKKKTTESSSVIFSKEEKRRTRSETRSRTSLNKKAFNGRSKNNHKDQLLMTDKDGDNRKCNDTSVNKIQKIIKSANRKIARKSNESIMVNSEKKSLRNQTLKVAEAKSHVSEPKKKSEGTLKRRKVKEKNQAVILSKRARKH